MHLTHDWKEDLFAPPRGGSILGWEAFLAKRPGLWQQEFTGNASQEADLEPGQE